ncbi:hypothetical protein CSKR_114280 [Clonorchis sinensis]|uniref:Uncharacterized protein n=1 Tax=Clonorchis sinensis TaxID=79923 RepID=A0A419QHM3_CLOSI|nr:hypothetical protein CSKR_114280 [Clonorchis sinensis]
MRDPPIQVLSSAAASTQAHTGACMDPPMYVLTHPHTHAGTYERPRKWYFTSLNYILYLCENGLGIRPVTSRLESAVRTRNKFERSHENSRFSTPVPGRERNTRYAVQTSDHLAAPSV